MRAVTRRKKRREVVLHECRWGGEEGRREGGRGGC